MKRNVFWPALAVAFALAVGPEDADAADPDPENTLVMFLEEGRVFIELWPDVAPGHVARIKELVAQRFYDGLVFHRVIEGFMAQTGDPNGDGTGGSGENLDAEFSEMPHQRGTVSMARSRDPNSADSQFFIMLGSAPHLDGQYTAWGRVISGMKHVDGIKKGDGDNNGKVTDPDRIIRMRLVADLLE